MNLSFRKKRQKAERNEEKQNICGVFVGSAMGSRSEKSNHQNQLREKFFVRSMVFLGTRALLFK
jgi:hypothetical protein